MLVMERITNAQGLWGILLPNYPQPEPRQFLLWTNRFTDTQIEKAFTRAHRKFAQSQAQQPEPCAIHRYVTGVLLNLEREQRQQPDGPSSRFIQHADAAFLQQQKIFTRQKVGKAAAKAAATGVGLGTAYGIGKGAIDLFDLTQ
jgi:hypothetical protein